MQTRLILKGLIYHRTMGKFLLDVRDNVANIPVVDIDGSPINDDLPVVIGKLLKAKWGLECQFVSIVRSEVNADSSSLTLLYTTSSHGNDEALSKTNTSWLSPESSRSLVFNDKLLEDLRLARDVCERHETALHLIAIRQDVSRKAVDFLEQTCVREEGLIGWPHYLGRNSVGVMGTSIGVLSLLHADAYSPTLAACLETIKGFQNEDGGWPVRSLIGTSGISVTESSLFALWALITAGLKAQDEAVVRGIDWLERNQHKDGGWGSSSRTERSRVFPTAFAVQTLCQVNPTSNSVKLAIAWLQDARNPDGGWGFFSRNSPDAGFSIAHHTAQVIIGFLASGMSPESELVQKSVQFILSKYSEDIEEGWESLSEVEYVTDDSALDYRHHSTPYCVVALVRSGVPFYQREVLRAFHRLLQGQQSFGYWSNRLVPGQIPVWAIHDCLYALKEVNDSITAQLDLVTVLVTARQEANALRSAMMRILALTASPKIRDRVIGHNRWLIAWNLMLSVVLAYIGFRVVYQTAPPSSITSFFTSYFTPLLVALIVGLAPFIYQLAVEEYKLKRGITRIMKGEEK